MREASRLFLLLGLFTLFCGLALGCVTGIQFLYPNSFLPAIPFHIIRPLHTSFAVWWLFLTLTGGVYYYLSVLAEKNLFSLNREWIGSPRSLLFGKIHITLFLIGGILIISSYLSGNFGGKEYLEYPPYLSIPMFLGWIFFAANVYRGLGPLRRDWPVFLWMWSTALFFFCLSFIEAHLWIIPYFGGNIIRDVTVQWKSYGALVATWNMFIYGTAMCVMFLLSGDKSVLHSKKAWFLYFIGLMNSLFNWAHHSYTVPAAPWIREVAYLVSMTELVIFALLIWSWSKSYTAKDSHCSSQPYRFLLIADLWVILNLILALALSVPAINVYLHGTHAVVAHSMGTTVGINTMILLSSLYFIAAQVGPLPTPTTERYATFSRRWINICLIVFWLALIAAGVHKGILIQHSPDLPYREVMLIIRPYIFTFVAAGFAMALGFLPILYFLTRSYIGWSSRELSGLREGECEIASGSKQFSLRDVTA